MEFDSKVYTNVLHSVYANWIVYDGKFLILDYNTSDGGKRVEETLAGWNWKVMQMQEIDQDQIAPVYPEMHENGPCWWRLPRGGRIAGIRLMCWRFTAY